MINNFVCELKLGITKKPTNVSQKNKTVCQKWVSDSYLDLLSPALLQQDPEQVQQGCHPHVSARNPTN